MAKPPRRPMSAASPTPLATASATATDVTDVAAHPPLVVARAAEDGAPVVAVPVAVPVADEPGAPVVAASVIASESAAESADRTPPADPTDPAADEAIVVEAFAALGLSPDANRLEVARAILAHLAPDAAAEADAVPALVAPVDAPPAAVAPRRARHCLVLTIGGARVVVGAGEELPAGTDLTGLAPELLE